MWSGRVSCMPIEIDPADSGLSSRRQVPVSERLVTGGSRRHLEAWSTRDRLTSFSSRSAAFLVVECQTVDFARGRPIFGLCDWSSAAQLRVGHKSAPNGGWLTEHAEPRVDKFKLCVDYVCYISLETRRNGFDENSWAPLAIHTGGEPDGGVRIG